MDYINYVKEYPMSMSGMGGPVGALNFHSGASAAWYGSRATFGAGFAPGVGPSWSSNVQYFNIATTGNATNAGNLYYPAVVLPAGTSDGTRGVVAGGKKLSPNVEISDIKYSDGGGPVGYSGFGDLQLAVRELTSTSDGTRGLFCGGTGLSPYNTIDVIDFVTIQTTGDATDFGDLTNDASDFCGQHGSNGTRGVIGNAGAYACSQNLDIDYMTIATNANAQDFGDLTRARGLSAGNTGTAVADRAVWSGGCGPGVPWSFYSNSVMDYVTISTTGNATDFGGSIGGRYWDGYYGTEGVPGCNNEDNRAVFAGRDGNPAPWIKSRIDYFAILTSGNSNDFGDLTRDSDGSFGYAVTP